MITEEITIRHLDIILESMNVVGKFSVLDILTEKADFDWNKDDERSDFNKLRIEVERLGKMYGYLDPVNNRPGIFTLTEKGIKAKKLKGHLKYRNSLKPKTPWLKIIPIILTSLLLILGYLSYNLKENQSDLTKELGTITKNHVLLKFENDSLKSHNTQLLKLVDSLVNLDKLKTDKLYSKKVELIESTKTD